MKTSLLVLAGMLALAGCASTESGRADAASGSAGTMTGAADYARMAAASDQFEIQSSQALLQASQNADLRRFAQMMIDHHTQTTAELTAAAQSASMTPPPPTLDERKAEMLRALQLAAGPARERLYIEQQVQSHQEALALHKNYASGGDNAALRTVAAKAVPIVQGHLTEAQRLMQGMS